MSNIKSSPIPATSGQKRIMETIQKELFPQIEDLKRVIVEIQTCRIFYQLYSVRLREIEIKYEKTLKNFFEAVNKLETPDILFSGLEKSDQNAVDYFQFQGAFKQNISEGIIYVEIIDRTLDRKLGAIQNNRTFLISSIALIISLVSIFS